MALAEIPLCVWRKRSQTFIFRDQSIRYWTAGQGEPLLLIHGFPSASWDWHYLWQPLAQRFRVIACDMLGFGDSAKPANHEYSLLEQADLQQALLEHLNVEQPVHLLAHDYGDSVAQELLARHYESRVELASCVFLNGGLFPETHHPLLMQKLLLSPLGWMIGRAFSRDGLVRSFRRIFGPQTRPSESQMDDFWSLVESHRGPRIMHKLIAYIPERRVWRNRWVSAMQRGEVPLRVIDGGVDPVSGVHMVERYRELIPEADTVVLPDIGHYPQIEAPCEVLKHYLAFRDQLLLPPRKLACS
ncbi:2-hydroxy-6-oxo-6-(2'-aminophenyl)hexa-2, 4-dienoic acid hydrolase [Pseudomonas fluorescens]|uniref:2-hydroxy-6-oxo-6-(2'-aminophenyl)hexa-2, 4-dienoic acid hydrolase n=1 Tax=Pseudomonas fluorescens TaxID=294 RepID=A0A8H2NSC4_PSEFL|nr:alpha/beta hydrolase [Pseudomonas fluorescens]CAG8870466.1 Cis-3-alkyl-4-alkyloxetan-2-one decarboxylase [Pseudomonas fluorescens]VVO05288.1 2-hydroxy-6-oxo-6-(2'-aminophenyl)hexa-2, 4-dienoic acid hydrolase [Pseudomonas fluorescens]VVP00812.1 2-hydroxy-6-oxo-6-(2'-aminophenyl)hexa-2, 4-dienoic acid hydrolase [Pseudomonas fluorescens]VVQ18435.1 2-hydroxy-6-oxo-6-(2'-aminophenyl)hexa-2, 4-dienoic acid hydrolase [Pseudomonas fluorescens]